MFKGKANFTPLANELEARSMVAFIDKLEEIKAVLKELDVARKYAMVAERDAYEAEKKADFAKAEADQKIKEADDIIARALDVRYKTEQLNKDVQKRLNDIAVKDKFISEWEAVAIRKEKEYEDAVIVLNAKTTALVEKEEKLFAREKALEEKLAAFRAV